jgi:hypothetical protein
MRPTIPVLARFGLCAAAAALAACAPEEGKSSGTRGELGHVDFTYQRSCFFGCPLEQPLLAGTREQIELSAQGDADGLRVKSSRPAVAKFAIERACYCERSDNDSRLDIREDAKCTGVWRKHCDNQVLVEALDPGETWLELRTADDALIDRARVLVHEAHDAQFAATLPDRLGPDEGTRFDLADGQSLDLDVTLYDADGRKLLAPEGVDWHVDDIQIATLSGFLIAPGADVHDGLGVVVKAAGPGDTSVHVEVPGLSDDVAIHVTK